ncbi:hypothetical protein JHK87_032667 [Glycine soja]|nr:hypothetical protein JHK87_032667 [Glycine soja]
MHFLWNLRESELANKCLYHLPQNYSSGYSKDLATYLKYCRDVVFAGSEPSYGNHEEEKMIEYLWRFYQNEEDTKPSENVEQSNTSFNQPRSRDKGCIGRTSKEEKIRKKGFKKLFPDDDTSLEDDLPGRMKLEMEDNRFYYIPPSVKHKRLDYIHYVRKRDEGALTYVARADYYILLRACARIAQVDIRTLHIGVLRLERRLAWLEKRVDQCLHSKPTSLSCQFCSDKATENGSDGLPGLSNLNI